MQVPLPEPPSPPAHTVLVHSKLLLQAAPVAFGVVLHTAVVGTVSQKAPDAQPALTPAGGAPVTLHEVAHDVPSAHAKLFGQAPAVPALHVPVPLHMPAGVSVLPVHEAVPQDVVDAVSSQTPPDAHLPVKPQGGAAVH